MAFRGGKLCAFVLMVLSACGGDDGPTAVDELGESEAEALCRDFFETVCTVSQEGYCVDCNASDPCSSPDLQQAMDSECAGIADSLVEACADELGTLEDGEQPTMSCLDGGGCMFDVGDLLCTHT